MAFVDVTVPYASAGGQVSAQVGGAPQGGGVQGQGVSVGRAPSGAKGPGTDVAVRHWVLGFFLFIAVVLFSAGKLFNGKGGS